MIGRGIAAFALVAGALSASAQAPRLGSLSFPTSGNATAQPHFITGVLYLHSFEYEAALKEFKEAERLDPSFTMAYWGEAMTYTHPVWDEQDSAAARAALARAPNAKTPREGGFLAAVKILYGAGGKAQRDTLYSAAMAALAKNHPDDVEAQLFYALSLLGLSQGDRDVPTYLRAGAIAETAFAHHPDHPGAAHYVIHSYDDPQHAAIALTAARAYSKIAPDAAHAQHMTSHIFLALGLWDDVVSANVTALHVVHMVHQGRGACGHYPEWLEYGYLQLGQLKNAAQILDACSASPGAAGPVTSAASPAIMRAAYIVDSRDWSGRIATQATGRAADARAAVYLAFGTGYAAAMRGDTQELIRSIVTIDSARKVASDFGAMYGNILAIELSAAASRRSGALAGAEDYARAAARIDDSLPMPFGPPVTIKPPHELLGEIMLAAQRPDSAIVEFQLALARTPRRPLALLGLAQAQYAAGHGADAAATYALLAQIWNAADADLPSLDAVRAGAAAKAR